MSNHRTHRWSGWPGAFCQNCGQEDWKELELASVPKEEWAPLDRVCPLYSGETPNGEASGYHTRKIRKGELGEASKIREEFEEFQDALLQENTLMALHELSDLYGAISAYLKRFNLEMRDLEIMSKATSRAFKSGERK